MVIMTIGERVHVLVVTNYFESAVGHQLKTFELQTFLFLYTG